MGANIEAARDLLQRHPGSALVVFSLFVVSPLPSAQLFMAQPDFSALIWSSSP
jgi:hypothetical protein